MAQPPLKIENAPQSPAEVSVMIIGQQFVFRDDDGHEVYVFDGDKPGQPTCAGPCLVTWKPVPAPETAKPIGNWTIVTRQDGKSPATKQWAYKGRPVYIFIGSDHTKPVTADSQWHALLP